jgi:hypothetical protein
VAAGIAEAAWHLDAIDFGSIFTTPSERLRNALHGFDRVVVWMSDNGVIEHRLREMGIASVQVWPGLPPADWTCHATAWYLHCVGQSPEATAPILPIQPISSADIIIHPGSGSAKKNWPLANFLEVAAALEQRGRNVSWSIGPAEEAIALPAVAQRLPQTSLTDLAGILAGARLYIGNDSGISHLAAAVGTPSVLIFGPSNARMWRPLGERVCVVQGEPWPEVGEVLEVGEVDSNQEHQGPHQVD